MNSLFSLINKNIILTGGCGNLGREMAKCLLEYGATVIIADILESLPKELEDLGAEGNLIYIKCNLSSTQSVREMLTKASQQAGGLDVLVNNAAYGGGAGGKGGASAIDGVDDDAWALGMDGTIGVAFRCTREILPYFDNRGVGIIVNIASMYGTVAPDPSIYGDTGKNSPPAYGAGKAATIQLTKYCASHLAGRGIRVNCIVPGPFPRITPDFDRDFHEKLKAKTMLGRTGMPSELSGPLLLLTSEASSFMTGSMIVVDGGWTAW